MTPSAQAQGMKIVCLGYGDENTSMPYPTRSAEGLIEECMAYDAVLRKYGQSVGGVALQSVRSARTGLAGRQGAGYRWALRRNQGAGRGSRHQQVHGHRLRPIEAWLKHPCLRVGDVLKFALPTRSSMLVSQPEMPSSILMSETCVSPPRME